MELIYTRSDIKVPYYTVIFLNFGAKSDRGFVSKMMI
jgi:hypothetical protein